MIPFTSSGSKTNLCYFGSIKDVASKLFFDTKKIGLQSSNMKMSALQFDTVTENTNEGIRKEKKTEEKKISKNDKKLCKPFYLSIFNK